jgi:hypothetical protein
MFNRILLMAALMGIYPLPTLANSFLVSAEEMNLSNAADTGLRPKSVPAVDAPIIELVSPKLPGEVTSPTIIELRFIPVTPSTIRPETFKALYGALKVDITSRILGVTEVTPSGILVKEAKLPKGKHRIQLLLEDSLGRVGSRWMEFEVK